MDPRERPADDEREERLAALRRQHAVAERRVAGSSPGGPEWDAAMTMLEGIEAELARLERTIPGTPIAS